MPRVQVSEGLKTAPGLLGGSDRGRGWGASLSMTHRLLLCLIEVVKHTAKPYDSGQGGGEWKRPLAPGLCSC